MLKRRTVRTWRNIMISNCSPVCTVSLELGLALFFNFVQRAGQGVQAWKMVHKFSSTAGIASGHGPGSQTYSLILPQVSCSAQYPHLPDRSDIPALVAHFFFSILSLVAMLQGKIGTSPPCNWAKHSSWKSTACGRRATHLSLSPLCHWRVSRPNHHQLTRNILPASTSFEASPECLLVRVSYCNSAYDNDRWLTIFLDIAGFCSPEVQKDLNQIAQLLSKVTVNCAPWTQLTLRLHPRHCNTNISLMSQSAKYNLGAGWAGHRIKRTGWEHSMGLTLVLVAIHNNLCRITSSFPKRQADQEVLRQVRLSLLKNFASFATKLRLWG